MQAIIPINQVETGLSVTIPLMLFDKTTEEGKTGYDDTDLYVALRDTTGTTAALVVTTDFTVDETDGTNLPGSYILTILPRAFPTVGMYVLFVWPAVADDFYPVTVPVEIVAKQWARFAPDFDSVAYYLNQFLKREGIAP